MMPALRLLKVPGNTPFGIFTNIFDATDRACCGGWYLDFHVGPWRLECYSRRSK